MTTKNLKECALAGNGQCGFDGLGNSVVAIRGADAPSARAGEDFEVFGGVVHEDGGAGGLEHGDVVPVIADGQNLRGVDAPRGGQGKQCGALGATGGEDVEDGEIAVGVVGAIEGKKGDGRGIRFGGFTSHPLR